MHADFYPGLSYDAVLDLPYAVWRGMALSSDRQVAQIVRSNEQIRSRGGH